MPKLVITNLSNLREQDYENTKIRSKIFLTLTVLNHSKFSPYLEFRVCSYSGYNFVENGLLKFQVDRFATMGAGATEDELRRF